MRDFKDYSKVILAHEGGYIHDLDDPGGETNFGICKRCLHKNSKILTSNFTWKLLSDLNKGDTLISFSEVPETHGKLKIRRFEESVVEDIGEVNLPAYQILTQKGTIIASSDHLWLSQHGKHNKFSWVRTEDLINNSEKHVHKNTKNYLSYFSDPWEINNSREAGYLAGILDGEGCIGTGLSFTQKNNLTLKEAINCINKLGYSYRVDPRKGECFDVIFTNPLGINKNNIKILGELQAKRLIENFKNRLYGQSISSKYSEKIEILSVVPIGNIDLIGIKTSNNTIISDGFLTHNSYPYLDIKNLTKEKASEIYYKDYWLPMNLNLLPNEELKLHLFDMGVNAGIRTAIKLLQSMLIITSDGVIGNDTVKAVSSYDGDIVKDYMSVRKNYYQQLTVKNPKLLKFLKGWITRVNTTKF